MSHLAINLIIGLRASMSVHWDVTTSEPDWPSWGWFRSYSLLLGPLSLGIVAFREFGR